MKKNVLVFSLISCMVFLYTSIILAQDSSIDKARLVGTWEQCDSTGHTVLTGPGITEYKIITPQTFNVLQVDKAKGIFMGIFFGVYSLENDIYTETISYTIPQGTSAKGMKNLFYVSFKKELLYIVGINNKFNQIWKKVDKLIDNK